jgi:matrixin
MRNKLGMAIASVALLTMVSSAVFGYALLSPARRWFPPTPITVRVSNTGLASVNDSSNGASAAAAAVGAWNNGGVNVASGQTASVSYTQGDGQSDIIFGDPLNLCTGSCIAATLTGYYNTSQTGTCGGLSVVRVTDADVAFNLSYNYTTVAETNAEGGCSNEIYLEAVTTHEVGHVIGLGHSSVSAALMAPTVTYCVNKPLNTDDFSGRNALYNCTFSGGGGGCSPAGASCTQNSNCCSNSCKGKPGQRTCR